MSLAIPEHYVRTFETNWNHEVQQRVSRLRSKVKVETFEGKEKVLTDLDEVSFVERLGRLTKSDPSEATGDKRKLVKRNFKCQKIFDKDDNDFLGMLGEPTSELIEAMGFAWDREVDELIIEAASADALGGADPYTTPIPLPSSQQVPVNFGGSNVGITPQKIINARKIFATNEIFPSEDDLYLILSPEDIEDLTEFIRTSGNDVWATMIAKYEEDPSNKLFQFNVIVSNRLTKNTSTDVETAIAFSMRHGIVVAPEKMETHVDILPEQDHAKQISCYAHYGAVRRREKGVVEIYCDHSP